MASHRIPAEDLPGAYRDHGQSDRVICACGYTAAAARAACQHRITAECGEDPDDLCREAERLQAEQASEARQ